MYFNLIELSKQNVIYIFKKHFIMASSFNKGI
nr:MAG TPA: hypothetical protein [Caudoviricetes sp.]